MALLRLGAGERLCRLDCWDSPSCALFVWKTRDLSDATRAFRHFICCTSVSGVVFTSVLNVAVACSALFDAPGLVVASTPNGFFQTACEPLVFFFGGALRWFSSPRTPAEVVSKHSPKRPVTVSLVPQFHDTYGVSTCSVCPCLQMNPH